MKRLLAALVVTLGLVASAQAVCDHRTTTCFTNVDVSGALSVGSSNITTSPLTASDVNATYGVTGATATFTTLTVSTVTISGSQGLRLTAGSITAASTVPAAANILAHDSSNVLYISTGTGAGAWVKVGGQ
jgi:hypothetical protein